MHVALPDWNGCGFRFESLIDDCINSRQFPAETVPDLDGELFHRIEKCNEFRLQRRYIVHI